MRGINLKFSNQSLDKLLGTRKRARHKTNRSLYLEQYFEEPIIHREIQGDRVYVSLNLNRAWNKI
jgi:hypothetical protein